VLDQSYNPSVQVINDVTCDLRIPTSFDVPHFRYKVWITYIPYLAKDPINELKEYSVNLFEDFSIFRVTMINRSDYDLDLAQYQFIILDADGNRIDAMNRGDDKFPHAVENQIADIMKR
jgi:hypothetical protein